ncbi:MAG: phosphatase PAP2 family protein [Candidatus Muiribacteriota bacterium]
MLIKFLIFFIFLSIICTAGHSPCDEIECSICNTMHSSRELINIESIVDNTFSSLSWSFKNKNRIDFFKFSLFAALVQTQDKSFRRFSQRNQGRTADRIFNFAEKFGRSHETAYGNIFLYLYGMATGDNKIMNASSVALEGTIISGNITEIMKSISKRTRPDGVGKTSFPSGHSAISMSLATSFSHHYPSKSGLFYSIAGLCALQRVYADRHYLSDIITGSTIGYLVTRKIIDSQYISLNYEEVNRLGFSFNL